MLTDAQLERIIKNGTFSDPDGKYNLKFTKPRIYNGFKGEFTEAKYEVRLTWKASTELKERLNKMYKDFINSSN